MIDQADTNRTRTSKPKNVSHSVRTAKGLPENCNYPDTGCELASSCLECPLATCKYDDPNWNRRNLIRNQEIVRLRAQGLSVSQIAEIVNTSERTVYRISQHHAESQTDQPPQLNPSKRSASTRENRVPVEQLAVWYRYSEGQIADLGVG